MMIEQNIRTFPFILDSIYSIIQLLSSSVSFTLHTSRKSLAPVASSFFFAGYNIYNTSTKNSKALFNIYLVVRLFAQFTPFFV